LEFKPQLTNPVRELGCGFVKCKKVGRSISWMIKLLQMKIITMTSWAK